MTVDVSQWLVELGLGEHVQAFTDNRVDADVLLYLTGDDLKDIGVAAVGDRRKILEAISKIRSNDAAKAKSTLPETPEASRRQVTVLFADISDFTRVSSGMDAEETHAFLNDFFSAVDMEVRAFGGNIDKHIGDAVMGVFGAPVAHTDDPERAVRAAMRIHAAVANLDPPLLVHIGIASGQVVASETGSTAHKEYTVTGDSVNLAARLTDLAEAGETLTSHAVQRALGDRFNGESLGEQLIPGLPEPMIVWRLQGIAETINSGSHPFVGRLPEIARFQEAVEHCLAKKVGRTLIVRGEAGIGKTRLLEEFERIAAERGFQSHTGLVLDFGTAKGEDAISSLTLHMLNVSRADNDVMRSIAIERAITNDLLGEYQRVFLNDLLDLPQSPELRGLYDAMDNEARNRGKREAVTSLVRALSFTSPLLIRVEDLHWADPVVLAHAAHLAEAISDCSALLLLTTRLTGDPFDETWQLSTGNASISTIDLGPIQENEASELAETFEDIGAKLVRKCIQRSGGNPLFLEQLLRNVDELGADEIPGTVQGIVQARMDALSALDRDALQSASVLGQRFSSAALAALTADANNDLTILLKHGLIRPAGNDYQFAHALIRDGVHASLLKPRCIELHARAAAWYRDVDLSLYAEHLGKAEDPGAAEAYLAAALEQSAAFRPEAAIKLVDKGIALASESETKFELLCMLGNLCRDLGQGSDALNAYEKALASAAGEEQTARACLGIAESYRLLDRLDAGFEVLERAEAAATRIQSSLHLARIHFVRGNYYFPLGELDKCRLEHETALDEARRCYSLEAEARALGGLADAAYLQRRMRTAMQNFERCIELANKENLTNIVAANISMLATTRGYNLEFENFRQDGRAGLDLARRLGRVRAEVVTLAAYTYWCVEMDDHAGAIEMANSMLDLVSQYNLQRFEATGLRQLALAHHCLGLHVEAVDFAEKAWASAKRNAERFTGPWALAVLALVTSDQKQRTWALAEGERILDDGSVGHNYLWFHRLGMEVGIELDNPGLVDHHANALEFYTRYEALPWSEFYIDRGRVLADVARNRGGSDTEAKLLKLRDRAHNAGLMQPVSQIEAAITKFEDARYP